MVVEVLRMVHNRHLKCVILVHIQICKLAQSCQKRQLPYFTVEAPTCFDSYNQPRLGGGWLFEHAAIEPWKRPPKNN